jgi:phage gp29-like protein
MSKRPRPYSSVRGGARVSASRQLPAELNRVIATTHDGRDITRPYVGELEEFRDVRLQGATDWGAYDRILLDDQVKSCLEQRRSAVVAREWSVIPGDAEDPRSVAAAEALEANLQRIAWDRVTDKMLYAPFFGFAVAELLWEVRDGLFQWSEIRVRHARRFRKDKNRRLRLITTTNINGEILPERKFWEVTAGGSDDDEPYGRGLAEWLYWPTLFKRNGIRFWNAFLDKFSVPTAKGTYRPGTPRDEINKLLDALSAIANDTGFVVPEGMAVELLQVASNGIDFEKMPKYMDEAIAKVILSQTMTTGVSAAGLGSGQANVQAGVKQEIITADADLLTDSFSAGPSRWFTDLNFGSDVAAPIVLRHVEAEEDLKSTAETDAVLARFGWNRTEESFKDVYGDGYERAEPTGGGEGEQANDKRTPAAGPPEEGDDRKVIPFQKVASLAELAAGPPPSDVVDEAVAAVMADEGWVEAPPLVRALVGRLVDAKDEEEVKRILSQVAELDDEDELVNSIARAAFAVRMAAQTGTDGQ